MRPTRRGWAAIALVALALTLAQLFSPRSLNAVAAPLLVGLAVGAAQVARAPRPTLTADAPRPGFPGDTRRRQLRIDGGGLARVRAPLVDGLTGADVDRLVALPATVESEYDLAQRGVCDHGSVTVVQRDSLGLLARRTVLTPAETQVVYPALYDLGAPGAVPDVLSAERAAERGSFDALREYAPGDPLRDVHWKTSAKHGDLLVMEFADESATEPLTIAAEAAAGAADEMASTAATLAVLALERGRSVSLAVPEGSVDADPGDRATVLALLARTGAGRVAPAVHDRADVSITARPAETTVTVGGRSLSLAALRGEVTRVREVPA